ncbi:MAG: bifunctional phosphoribosyl-AMP cyclohydrolase/phosphoribosyl-ATP diphosphatase HisIE [Candidatus Odinarchaeota archaeon]
MIILKINMKDMKTVGSLKEFIDGVYIKRNWDLFITLVLETSKESLIALIKSDMLKRASKKVKIWSNSEINKKELNNLLTENRMTKYNPQSHKNDKILSFDSIKDYSVIDNILFKILDFDKGNGLIPTIVQDLDDNVLMLAYSSKESLKRTIKTRRSTYFSRSRNRLWIKGEESGNYQIVKKIFYDCDADTLLFKVKQKGFACHTGSYSCFQDKKFSIKYLYDLIIDRIENYSANESYSKKLAENNELLMSKIEEECTEVINYTDRNNLIWEIADVVYFILVLMATKKIKPEEIINELRRRNR